MLACYCLQGKQRASGVIGLLTCQSHYNVSGINRTPCARLLLRHPLAQRIPTEACECSVTHTQAHTLTHTQTHTGTHTHTHTHTHTLLQGYKTKWHFHMGLNDLFSYVFHSRSRSTLAGKYKHHS